MSQLPVLKQTYSGTYVLPIVFELEGRDRSIKAPQEAPDFVASLPKELQNIYVIGYLK